MRIVRPILFLGTTALLLTAQAASAASFPATGTIASVYVAGASNAAFRVAMTSAGSNPLAACNIGVAFINKSDDNYEVKVTTLLTAFSQGKAIYATIDQDAGGDCTIREFGTS